MLLERLNGINNRQGTNRENKMFKELLIANYPIKELFNKGNIHIKHQLDIKILNCQMVLEVLLLMKSISKKSR